MDIHKGHRTRLRDRVRKEGLENFENYQVLEYLLSFVIPYKDTNVIAHNLINKFGSLAGVLEATEDSLKDIDGLGDVSAHFLSNLIKIFFYYEKEKNKQTKVLNNPKTTYEYLKSLLSGKLNEEVYLICLTAKCGIVSVDKITEGVSNQAHIPMRTITDIISRNKVSNVIIAHNHPKGDAEPSDDDHKFTRALVTTLSINSCHLLDHIIIGDGCFYSYRSSGLIEQFRNDAAKLMDSKVVAQPEANYRCEYDKK